MWRTVGFLLAGDDSSPIVMPAKAGIQSFKALDSRFRGNDECFVMPAKAGIQCP